jgi:hypothetical protein
VIEGDRPNFHRLVSKFREYRSITSLRPKAAASHSAFEATLNSLNKDGQKPKVRNCLCGQQHLFIKCPYLIEAIQKPGWNPKANIKKKVNEALKKGSNSVKAAVARAREKLRKGSTSTTSTSTPRGSPKSTRSAGFILATSKRQSSSPKPDLQGITPTQSNLSMVASYTTTTNSPSSAIPYSKSSVFKVTNFNNLTIE